MTESKDDAQGMLLPDDDPRFITLVRDYLRKGAATKRGLTDQEYVQLARREWHRGVTDQVFVGKILIDLVAEPSFWDPEEDADLFCVLFANVGSDGNLVDAPPHYIPPSIPGVRLSCIVAGSPPDARLEEPPSPEPNYYLIAYLDVLGFENLLKRVGLVELNQIYERLLNTALAPSTKEWARGTAMVLGQPVPALMHIPVQAAYFSDSLLLWAPYHPTYIEEFLRRSALVFCEALRLDLPIRGAITFGEAILHSQSRVFLGMPLVEAARLEDALDWIGLALGESFKSETLQGAIFPFLVQIWEPPLKHGRSSLFSGLVVDWPRVWRETYQDSAIPYLSSLRASLPENLDDLKMRYDKAIEFFEFSRANEQWMYEPIPESSVG